MNKNLSRKILLLTLLATSLTGLLAQESGRKSGQKPSQEAVRFAYRHDPQRQYRIVAQVDEQIYRNRKLVYNTQILNRIAVRVAKVAPPASPAGVAGDGAGRVEGQSALLYINYQISEQAEDGLLFRWATESNLQLQMTPLGEYQNLPKPRPGASLPSLRHVPSFPQRRLRPGEGWTAPGEELQDLSEVFGIAQVLRFQFEVYYLYRGVELVEGRKLDRITLFYNINEDLRRQLGQQSKVTGVPRSIRARHNIELHWDREQGLPLRQREDFSISYLLGGGDELEFRGRSRASVIQAQPMQQTNLQQDIENELEGAGLDADVRRNEKGISISLDALQFYPNSERLLPGQESKLRRISEVLRKYPRRDILVTGHTADVGHPKEQLELSQKRAAVVGQFLLQNSARSREQIVIRGVGETQPVAPNNSEKGRRKNRRVEITLLEN